MAWMRPIDARGQQIVNTDGLGQALVDLARDQTHLGKVFEDELFALLLGHGVGLIVISRCRQSRLLYLVVPAT